VPAIAVTLRFPFAVEAVGGSSRTTAFALHFPFVIEAVGGKSGSLAVRFRGKSGSLATLLVGSLGPALAIAVVLHCLFLGLGTILFELSKTG
jgi:hypothetical protein